ncbi:MAG TPA: hypothetical protein VHD32_07190 [Candidatus Didemnitutus sp.]|nr:hypothetical protein [Candidatus Didemnitutus sp.]
MTAHRSLLTILAFAFAASFAAAAESIPSGWFPWPAVEPIDGSALDASFLNDKPGPDGLPRISVRDGHFARPDGQRVRFWAANLAAVCAFPPTEDQADFIARELAKGGVNLVRLHHLDNAWGVGQGGSIWPADHPEHRELDSAQLNKLHRLIAALARHGIYSNLNLKVSKSLVAADGFPASVEELPNFQKRVDIFDPRMIELQKDYARRLLTTRNPYTGHAPADDPAIAIVEINNENSLVGYWTRDLGRGLDKLPEYFRQELQGQWNRWLIGRYHNDTALAAAWAPGASSGDEVLPPTAVWSAGIQPGSAGTVATPNGPTAPEINVSKTDDIDWHVQVSTHGLNLRDGEVYTVEFEARADHPRKIGVAVGLDSTARPHEDWRSFGLLDTVDIGTDWTPVRLSFPTHSVAGAPAALSLNAGSSAGTVSVRGLRFHAGSSDGGIRPGQSAQGGTVPIPVTPTTQQWADWIHFLADTERLFSDEMRRYLKEDLHVKALVVCTPIDYGGLTGLNREQAMDFADGHAYWQHPDFPGGWSKEHWSIRNSPELAALSPRGFGVLGDLALVRVAGKPYTVSEFDHPAPSEYVCEMYPTVATFGARQDWDAIYPFSVGEYGAANPDGRITDFFDQLHHPAKRGLSAFAAITFRRGLVAPAPASAELHLGSPVWGEQPHADTLWRQLVPEGDLHFLDVRYAVSDHPGAPGARATLNRKGSLDATPPVRLEKKPSGSVWVVGSPEAAAVVGYVGGTTVDAGAMRVACGRFGLGFASITAVALDGQPLESSRRVLVSVVARASNQDIVWNEAHNSLGLNWGHGPTIAEAVPAMITLRGKSERDVFVLAPDGTRAGKATTIHANNETTFSCQTSDQTIEYEIVAK